jgi:hypothetical protein
MWKAYVKAGKPKNVKQWLRDQLAPYFKSVGEPPKWIDNEPQWPYIGGKPMTFIAQVQVPEHTLADGTKTSASVVYLFSYSKRLKELPGAHQIKYHVIEDVAMDEDARIVKIIRGPREF